MKYYLPELKINLKTQLKKKRTTVSFEDIWERFEHEQTYKPRKLTIPKIGIAASLVILLSVPVVASVKIHWNHFDFVPMNVQPQPQENTSWLPFEMYPDYLRTYQNFNLEEAQKIAGFKIMRPAHFDMPLELSVGTKGSKSNNLWYWDIFHEGDQWVYVKQSLEPHLQKLDEEQAKLTLQLPSDVKTIFLNDKNAIAFISDLGEGGKMISMLVKNKENQIIAFEIRGNIGKEKLIQLAKSYK
jgi:hypothetical protein